MFRLQISLESREFLDVRLRITLEHSSHVGKHPPQTGTLPALLSDMYECDITQFSPDSFTENDIIAARFAIGIDLGTTNIVISYVDLDNNELQAQFLLIPQLVGGDNMDLALAHYSSGLFAEQGVCLELDYSAVTSLIADRFVPGCAVNDRPQRPVAGTLELKHPAGGTWRATPPNVPCAWFRREWKKERRATSRLRTSVWLSESGHISDFGSTMRPKDAIGTRLQSWSPEELVESAPVETRLEASDAINETWVPVRFHSNVTELGVLELGCVNPQTDQRWILEFSVK
ncbi:MAG: hypothetical protein MK110_12220 [Fuerstiella sp.]|nr:hypothetical protein [Fuerstiella sp.]